MKPETIKRITEKYEKKLEEIAQKENKGTPNHFRHISAQPMFVMAGNKDLINLGAITWEEARKDYLSAFIALKKYLGLLENFPDFKEIEITEEIGAFPKVRDYGEGGAQNYIDGAERILTKRNVIRKCGICGVIEREGVRTSASPADIKDLEEQGYAFSTGPLSRECALKYNPKTKRLASLNSLPESCQE